MSYSDSTLYLPDCGSAGDTCRSDSLTLSGKNFFTDKTLLRQEISDRRQGVPGKQVAYSVAADDCTTALLMICFIAAVVLVSSLRSVFPEQIRRLFYGQAGGNEDAAAAPAGLWRMGCLSAGTCLMYAFLYLFFLGASSSGKGFITGTCLLAGIFFCVLAVCFLLKALIAHAVNLIFFGKEKARLSAQANLFLLSCEGLFLMPTVYAYAYFGAPFQHLAIYVFLVFFVFRLLTIYKQRQIFFKQKHSTAGFFLYLCTLELTPFFMMWNVLAIAGGYLITNFY